MTSPDSENTEQASGALDWSQIATLLTKALRPTAPPVAISFHRDAAQLAAVPSHDAPFATAAADGRSGRVAAGCVFWTDATRREFKTVAADHGNCSVGSLTHGFKQAHEVVANDDVKTLLGAGWVSESDFAKLPVVTQQPESVVYAPLAATSIEPDVVLVRVNGRGLMTIKDTVGDLAVEGKPQCHIIAIAKEQDRVAASVGCALSRARTGMGAEEMTCAFPAHRLHKLAPQLANAARVNSEVASYAGEDAQRFRRAR